MSSGCAGGGPRSMRFTKMDDPVKGVGFVAIYFAYLEDELDELLGQSGHLFTLPDKIDRWKFRDKAKWLQKQLRTTFDTYAYLHSDEERARAESILTACREAALKRNDIVHLPIFGDRKGGAMQKDLSGKMRPLDVAKIYRFAEHVFDLGGAVYGLHFVISRLLKARETVAS